ncbi:MAG: MBL fold metallo-hydrolase [Aigarchaeota archaeon]|nr:MBL fold metallo-hydrolase [Candidatus Geocrenenecus dongiae]
MVLVKLRKDILRGLLLQVGGARIVFDSKPLGTDCIQLISHAHLDHIESLAQKNVFMSVETASILSSMGRRGYWKTLRRREKVVLRNDVEISNEPSGHVLGSSQFIVDVNGDRIVYTGDLNTYENLIHGFAEPIPTDILIIESTYGSPVYKFPVREKIYADIVKWIMDVLREGSIPAFKVYSLGKSQEVISLVNVFLDVPVVAGLSVSRISRKYREHGVRLGYIPVNTREGLEVVKSGEFVYVSSSRDRLPIDRRIKWAVASGWAVRFRYPNYDKAFPLSGHSDYYGLIDYIEHSNPKKIYTVYGYAEEFARNLKRRGFDAEPIIRINK